MEENMVEDGVKDAAASWARRPCSPLASRSFPGERHEADSSALLLFC